MARETLDAYPDRRVFLTSPILHNPAIHAELVSRGVLFLSEEPHFWNELSPRDIVLLPAFGVSKDVRERLGRLPPIVVDTTCGSVVFVWKNVDRLARDGYTIVYHGRRGHEEAVATLSRLQAAPRQGPQQGNPYFVVESRHEAEVLRHFLEGTLTAAKLLAALPDSASAGLDPERDLRRLGLASQTTMRARETAEISSLLREAQGARFGPDALDFHFRTQDTICGATQDRQDSVEQLLDENLDLVLVVGGYSSSNSSHLAEIASKSCAAYHVEGPDEIFSTTAIRHKVLGKADTSITTNWLPPGPVVIGVTSGASTPAASLERVIDRVATLAK
jgi:4-hydroxy-3-methylbut-2-enyl diphosphate reductase